MKPSRSIGGLAGAIALSFLLGLAPQQAGATVVLDCGDATSNFGTACGLDELVTGSILVDTTKFSFFGLTDAALDAANIRVDAIDTLYNPGFTLTARSGPLVSGDLLDNLVFDVTIDSGDLRIKDASLAVPVGAITPALNGFFDVFANLGPAVLDVGCDVSTPSCENSTRTDSALFSPVTALTDVLLGITVDTAGTVDINSITMQFSQVPEPGSLALLTLGLAGMGVPSRRRRQLAAG